MVLAGAIGTMPTAVSGVSIDSIQVLSRVPKGEMQKQRRYKSVLEGRRWAEA